VLVARRGWARTVEVRRQSDDLDIVIVGNLVSLPSLLQRPGGPGGALGWTSFVSSMVRKQQPDPVRVPGAYLRHAPLGGDMKLSGDDRASSFT
jgi:hypothetical protein